MYKQKRTTRYMVLCRIEYKLPNNLYNKRNLKSQRIIRTGFLPFHFKIHTFENIYLYKHVLGVFDQVKVNKLKEFFVAL